MEEAKSHLKFWATTIVIIAVAIYGVIILAADSVPDTGTPDKIGNYDWVRGNPEATVELIEYSDFQCPACGGATEIAQLLMNEFYDHVAFTYRHFPLGYHENAKSAAAATEAAGLQGKFWEMHDTIFANQKEWGREDASEVFEYYVWYAEEIGLDIDEFVEDYGSSKVQKAIQDDIDDAMQIGINATPTFFLNGEKVTNRDYDVFRQAIRDAIKENS